MRSSWGIPGSVLFAVVISAVPKEIVICEGGQALCEQPDSTGFAILALVYIGYFIGSLFYWGHLEGRRGQTVGKKAVGIKTVRTGTGEPIGFGRAIGRVFARVVSAIPCALGYLWMPWDDQDQTWHDKMVGSQVIQA